MEKTSVLDLENIKTQLANGRSIRATSRITGKSRDLVGRVKRDHENDIKAMSERLADSFFETAERALSHISEDKLANSNARDLGVLAGICTDKGRLISGASTANFMMVHAAACLKSAEDWGDGCVIEADTD